MRGREVELVGVCTNPSLLMGFNVPATLTALPSIDVVASKADLFRLEGPPQNLFFSLEKEKDVWKNQLLVIVLFMFNVSFLF